MSHIFTGVGVALTTPFKDNQVDVPQLRRHINYLIDEGVQAIIANGTTAESSTLTTEEQELVLKTVVEETDNRVKVIANSGTNNTATSIYNAKRAEELGADAIMLITPYYNKTSQRGLIKHFETIVDEIDLPVILYSVPSRTGMTIEMDTLIELSQHPQIVALKDATGDLDYFEEAKSKIGDHFAFYSGNDDNVQQFYKLGGDGSISVVANIIPNDFQAVFANPENDYTRLFKLVEALSIDVNPIPIKALTSHIGFGSHEVRLPLITLEADQEQSLIESYEEYVKLVK